MSDPTADRIQEIADAMENERTLVGLQWAEDIAFLRRAATDSAAIRADERKRIEEGLRPLLRIDAQFMTYQEIEARIKAALASLSSNSEGHRDQ